MKRTMMYLFAAAAVALSFTVHNQAQAQIPRFQTLAGTNTIQVARSLKQLPDSSYVVAGYTNSGVDNDVYLIRVDRNGNVLWSFSYNIGGHDYAYSLDIAADGGFIITGKTQNTGGCIRDDIFLMKTTNAGVLVWTMTYGGSGDDEGTCVQRTSDGGFIVSGRTNSFGAGSDDAFLMKTNSTGNITWSKTYGWSNADYFKSVQQTSDGGYIAGGATTTAANGVQSFIIKVNSTGDLAGGWSRTFGGTGLEIIWSLRQTNDGGYITAGTTTTYTGGASDALMVKFSGAGAFLWGRTYEFTSSWDEFLSVKETCTGELIFSGYCQGAGFTGVNGYVLKTTNLGAKIWSRAYGANAGGEFLWDIIQSSDGGYATAGQSSITGSFGLEDFYLVKMESAAGSSSCNDILLNETIVSRTPATDPTLPPVSLWDLEFPITPARQAHGSWSRLCFDAGTSFGNPCVIGFLRQNANHPETSEYTGITRFEEAEAYEQQIVLKQAQSTLPETVGQLRVLPNPVEQGGAFLLEMPVITGEVTLTITDVLGRVVHQRTFTEVNAGDDLKIATSGWSDGTYIVSVKTGSGVLTTPMIVRR